MASPPITKPLENIDSKKIRIIGVPLDLGQSRRGVDMGPSAVRVAGLEAKLEALGYVVEDKGNVPVALAETEVGRRSSRQVSEGNRRNLLERSRAGHPDARGRQDSSRCWAAITPLQPEPCPGWRSSIAAASSASACCGSMRTATSTRPRALPAATFTACRSAPSWACSPDRSPTCTDSAPR